MPHRLLIEITLIVLASLWVSSLFIAPLTLPPGTVILGEGGRANFLDYPGKWAKLPPYQRIVYTLGDMICHQKTSRSFIINGNQMPVCSRDVGLYTGVLAGLLTLFLMRIRWPEKYSGFVKTVFREKKRLFIAVYIALSLPAFIDFGLEHTSFYGGNNIVRAATGFMLGSINMVLLYYLMFEI